MEQISEQDFFLLEIKKRWNDTQVENNFDLGQQYEYCTLWWNTYKNNVIQKDLILLFDSINGNDAIWPMMSRKQYNQIGLYVIGHLDGFMTDYAFPIITNHVYFEEHLIKLLRFIKSKRIKWNFVKLNLPEWTGYIDHQKSLLNKIGNEFSFKIKVFDKYSYIPLEGNFESFISGLGYSTRADIRKYLRLYDKEDFHFRIFEGTDLLEKSSELIRLNNLSWNIFRNNENRSINFLESLLKYGIEASDRKLIMPVLEYQGQVIASVFGFMNKNRCFLHTAGVQRTKVRSLSPGITLYALIIKHLIENDIRMLDLSPGVEEYKLRLGAKVKTITQVVIFKNTYSKMLYSFGLGFLKAIKLTKRLTRKLVPKT